MLPFRMEQSELTRLGFRRGLDKEHRDYDLINRLEAALIRHAKGWDRFTQDIPKLLRQAIDEVIDAPRSGRFVMGEIEKTEKTYLGTKVEILLRNHLKLERGALLDVRIDDIEVDIKNTVGSVWMIPKEAMGHPCILISANEKKAKCSFGLVVIDDYLLTAGANQDKKRTISASGMVNVHWLLRNHDYPRNFWEDVPSQVLKQLTIARSGTGRLTALFRVFLRRPISRDTILALAPQKDTLKRLRKNGGARDHLVREGIALLSGKYHAGLINRLNLPYCRSIDFISVLPLTSEEKAILVAAGELVS